MPGGCSTKPDVVADASAVLDGHPNFRVELAGQPQVGVRSEVAQVGLLSPHVASPSRQVNGGAANDVAVSFLQHQPQRVDDSAHLRDGAAREELTSLQICGVSSADVRVYGAWDDPPLRIEVHYKPTQIAVIGICVDQEHRLA